MKNWVSCILFVFVEIQSGLSGKESIYNLDEYKKVNNLTSEYWFKDKKIKKRKCFVFLDHS